MSQHDRSLERTADSRPAQLGFALGLLLTIGLFLAAQASASYEPVGAAFGDGSHTPTGVAVNYTGAGGVPVGTLYVVSRYQEVTSPAGSVSSYDAKGEFREAWGWGVADGQEEFERCGPAGEPAHPICKSTSWWAGEGVGQLAQPEGIAVDQTTGYVYVLNSERKKGVVQVFTAAGEPVGEFGERAASVGVIEEAMVSSLDKIHGNIRPGRIAVDDSGTVYVGDFRNAEKAESRVMVFKPTVPGNYEDYEYTGHANDIGFSVGDPTYTFGRVAVDAAGNVYVSNDEFVSEFPAGKTTTPSCRYKLPGGQLAGMTVNPKNGEVFVSPYGGKFRQLAPCDSQGIFREKSIFSTVSKSIVDYAPAFNPVLSYQPSRPAGVLYVGGASGIETFAPAEVRPPHVVSESVSAVGATGASLEAQIDPEGSQTNYAFQYLTQEAYEANKPDEEQSLTVSATGGVFDLGFEGRHYGGEGTATLASGSAKATGLQTATGTATLKGASGTATLKAGRGTGTVISGSTAVTAVATAEGAFEVGQQISGEGIASETTIAAVKAGELTLSKAATSSAANVSLGAGSTALGSLSVSEGTFEVGETITGEGIPGETAIVAVKAGQLTISKAPTKPGTGVTIKAGSKQLVAVATASGHFEAGQPLEGTGIPANTTITAVEGAKLTLSKAITTPGTGVAIASPGPSPLAPGQRIEGPGIPAGTTIAAAKEGELTLSNPATSSGTVAFHAGLAFDASAGEVRHALEALPAIGSGNVSVSGGPGDEAGTSPYLVRFDGELSNLDLPLLEAGSTGLNGGSASATVQGENDGGNGFAGASETPVGGAVLGTGQEALGAIASLAGLQPDTAYYFRATASSPCNPEEEEVPCEASGQAKRFRTFPLEAPELPDRRAYELVSPARKAGGQVFRLEPWHSSCLECNQLEAAVFPKQSSPDGEALAYEGTPFATSGGGNREDEYVARRTSSGWQSTNLTPELITTGSFETGFKAFDPSLSKGLLLQVTPSLAPEAPSEYANLYGFSTTDPASLSPFLTQAPPNRGPNGSGENLNLTYAGATPDLTHTLFEANDALTAETPSTPEAIDGGSEENNLYESVEGELRLVNVLPGNTETVPGATFGSGNLAHPDPIDNLHHEYAFDNAISHNGSRIFWSDPSGQVFVREDGERTREISDHTGEFLTAAADGSQVLLSDGHLIGLGDEEPNTDLTEGKGGFEGLVGRSEDLSSIYFVDTAVLSGEENERGEAAQPGQNNLYLHRGTATSFVATLDNHDNATTSIFGEQIGDWHAASGYRSAEASPDGRYLAFTSRARLTGIDSTGNCSFSGGNRVTGRCEEVFLYDSQSRRLSCPSCDPAGRAPLGNATLPLGNGVSSFFQLQPRYLTDSGRLYFDSGDSLSTFDTNEGFEDLYQYEPEGVGTCTRSGGCVNLISAGTEAGDSNFYASDEEGKNVFFTTRDQLALKDKDDLLDVYDAREDGGIASETETSRGECQGEACQAPVSPPNDPTPGSSTFEGAGNVSEPKAAKKHAKKHKKKRHAKKHSKKRAAKHNRGGAK